MQACSTILANSDLSAETDQCMDTDKLSTACITFQELGQLTRSVCRSALVAMQHLVIPLLASMPALVICQALQTFPSDYPTAMRQAQTATLAALEDGHKLVEVEFPTSSLQGVSGTLLFLPVLHEYAPFLLFFPSMPDQCLYTLLCLVFLKSMLVYIAPLECHHITCSSSHGYVRFKLKLDASPASGSICTLLKSWVPVGICCNASHSDIVLLQ